MTRNLVSNLTMFLCEAITALLYCIVWNPMSKKDSLHVYHLIVAVPDIVTITTLKSLILYFKV